MMPAERVLELLDLLVDRGIDVWGDALAGRENEISTWVSSDRTSTRWSTG
jgi:hypothetical protein